MNELDRFESKVYRDPMCGCWLWTGAAKENGYGAFSFRGRCSYAHRVSFQMHHGPIPLGMHVCHRCDTPACVNPAHLFLGTAKENYADMRRKGRGKGPALGSAHTPACKLTAKQAKEIIQQRRAGGSLKAIAARFSVSDSTVSMVARGKTWRDVYLADME